MVWPIVWAFIIAISFPKKTYSIFLAKEKERQIKLPLPSNIFRISGP
jgi:hypothetical protein